MVKVTMPMLSGDASGTYAGMATFSKWKGRNYVRQTVTPHNPKSAKQVGNRVMMRYLSQLWASLTAPQKASWKTLAAQTNVSNFNAFVQANMKYWQQNEMPIRTAGTARIASTLTSATASITAAAGILTIPITAVSGTVPDAWGVYVGSSLGNCTPATCINLTPVVNSGVQTLSIPYTGTNTGFELCAWKDGQVLKSMAGLTITE